MEGEVVPSMYRIGWGRKGGQVGCCEYGRYNMIGTSIYTLRLVLARYEYGTVTVWYYGTCIIEGTYKRSIAYGKYCPVLYRTVTVRRQFHSIRQREGAIAGARE